MILRLFSVAIFIKERQYWSSQALSRQMSSATVCVVMLGEFFICLFCIEITWYKDFLICTWNIVKDGAWVLAVLPDLFWHFAKICYQDSTWIIVRCFFCSVANNVKSFAKINIKFMIIIKGFKINSEVRHFRILSSKLIESLTVVRMNKISLPDTFVILRVRYTGSFFLVFFWGK